MEYQDIWQQFTTLPPDAQALVADFITFLEHAPLLSKNQRDYRFIQGLNLLPYT